VKVNLNLKPARNKKTQKKAPRGRSEAREGTNRKDAKVRTTTG